VQSKVTLFAAEANIKSKRGTNKEKKSKNEKSKNTINNAAHDGERKTETGQSLLGHSTFTPYR